MVNAFREVVKIMETHKVDMRIAALMLGVGRVAEAAKVRGLYP
jgi:glutamate dehydrogenase (NAD(P)+)